MRAHRTASFLPLLLATFSQAAADTSALAMFVGNWEIRVQHLRPERKVARYQETYAWELDGKYIRGETGTKADGTRDIVFATWDEQSGGYPFWIFSSSGSYTYLPPASWDARKRVMSWENPPQFDISYKSSCHFPDPDHRSCRLIMKDWKGKVLGEMTWTATRRTP